MQTPRRSTSRLALVLAAAAIFSVAGCATEDQPSAAVEAAPATTAPPTVPPTIAPTTTVESVRDGQLRILETNISECPDLADGLRSHYDQWGNVMTCDDFVDALTAIADAGGLEALHAEEERKALEYLAAVAEEEAEKEREAQKKREAAEAEKAEEERKLLEFFAAVAEEEAEKEREAQKRREAAEAERRKDKQRRAAEAKAEAIQIGEALLRSQCHGNGGEYQYWTSPPRAQVTRCYAPRQTSQSNRRTGAVCNDGWRSSATGSGACSWHGGVAYWTY